MVILSLLAILGGGVLSYYYRNEVSWLYDKMREGTKTYATYYSQSPKRSEVRRSKSVGHLSYSHNGEEYAIVFPLKRGPSVVSSAWTIDENGDRLIITDELFRFAGLSKNFHGIPTTPMMLGWENGVWYEKLNNEIIFFDKNDCIVI